jgi:N6-L-threonylcarbamoyladenine synthase
LQIARALPRRFAAEESKIMTVQPQFGKPVRILGIETSCDETGLALLELSPGELDPDSDRDSVGGGWPTARVLGQALYSQIDLHKTYGGVVPELASRDHLLRIMPLLDDCLAQAGASLDEVDWIAVTEGPGLAGALLVGVSVAHGLAAALNKPLMGIHHLEGHLLSPLLDAGSQDLHFPFLALLVSGGHTQIMQVNGVGQYTLLGETIDDAAGEAFDKSAQLLELGYPGGPAISKWAAQGRADRFEFPRPLKHRPNLDFSFAGLKTAVLTQVQKLDSPLSDQDRADVAAGVQAAIVDVLVHKCMAAMDQTGLRQLVISGGVSANRLLRDQLLAAAKQRQASVFFPPLSLCTDNGVMIAWAAGLRLSQSGFAPAVDTAGLMARPRWDLASLAP